MKSISKNYSGHIYIKGNLQEKLNTPELIGIESTISVLFFPKNISLKKAKESLKIIDTILTDLIKQEKENNNETNLQEQS